MVEDENKITDALIISYIQGTLDHSTQQIEDIERWLSEEKNKNRAKKIFRAWELSTLVAPAKKDTQKAYNELVNKITPTKKIKTLSIWWYAAASVTIIAASIFILLSSQPDKPTILSAQTEVENFTLPDMSVISVDQNGLVTYDPYEFSKGKQRNVEMEGQAYFEIAHDPKRPFVVSTRDAEITVLGTKFMVKTSPDNPTKVLVTEGTVRVVYMDNSEGLILSAAQETETKTSDTPSVKPSDVNHLYWKTGIMKFENASIDKVINTLSQEFNTPITVQSNQILDCKLTATFKKQSLETILEVLANVHQLNIEKEENKIIISGNGCE